ncbi:hypothetical protein ACN47E_006492 [Coniothyrium glycines]
MIVLWSLSRMKYVERISAKFGPQSDQIHGYPDHPDIEIALLTLFVYTKNRNHLMESIVRGRSPDAWRVSTAYKPIADQDSIEGYFIRSMYLLTAIADLFRHDDT